MLHTIYEAFKEKGFARVDPKGIMLEPRFSPRNKYEKVMHTQEGYKIPLGYFQHVIIRKTMSNLSNYYHYRIPYSFSINCSYSFTFHLEDFALKISESGASFCLYQSYSKASSVKHPQLRWKCHLLTRWHLNNIYTAIYCEFYDWTGNQLGRSYYTWKENDLIRYHPLSITTGLT